MRRLFAVFLILLLTITATVAFAAPGRGERVSVLVGFDGPQGRAAIAAAGGQIVREFKFINAGQVMLPQQAMGGLTKAQGIRYVELDHTAYALGQTVPWGIERVNALQVHAANQQGSGINVAILDTGIMPNHEDLTVYGGADFVNEGGWNDGNGHGTHVAGTVAALNNTFGVIGVAPQARLYAVKVLTAGGSGSYSGIIAGIEWSVNNGMKVINMSLSGSSGSQAMEDACNAAYNAGVLIIAAAGNEGNMGGNNDTIGYPARYASVIAVGSTTANNSRSSFSSTGPMLEIMAPGSSILSTTYNGGYGTMSGTSMASPHVAGVAALIWAVDGNLTNVQLRNILNETANDMWNNPWRYGNGLVDAYAAYMHVTGGDGDPGDPDPTALNVTIATDKETYTLRQTIHTTVTAADENQAAISGADISMEILTASGRRYILTGTTGSDGKVVLSYNTKNPDGRGTYTLTATVTKGSLTETASKTVTVN